MSFSFLPPFLFIFYYCMGLFRKRTYCKDAGNVIFTIPFLLMTFDEHVKLNASWTGFVKVICQTRLLNLNDSLSKM